MTATVPILMLHEVSARPDPRYRKYTLTPRELDERLDWLRSKGYESVSMDDLVAARRGERALPARPVVITFDDGGRDCIEHAVPALAQRNYGATFYIVAGVVGGPMRWLNAEIGFELPAADWPALRAAEAAGMHCEAHSVTHPRLARVSADVCRDELTRGRAMLEEGLGHPVRHLAYPFGSHTAETITIAREAGYLTACTTEESLATAENELLALPRVPVLGTEGLGEFAHRVRTAQRVGPLRLELERVARRFGLPSGRRRS
ncbi:MAG TPA: polysaccharide deacetylase family protein [Gemmatimonadaceae bacterium]|nr:polysaccharide deacetylase family protein [Gemmatimonadaceae bacterium]